MIPRFGFVGRYQSSSNQSPSVRRSGPSRDVRGFGATASTSAPGRTSGSPGQAPSGQRQLYDAQIVPLLEAGLERKAEPLLLLLAQGTNPLPEVFRDLGNICEARAQTQDAESWFRRWLTRLPKGVDQRLAQARKAEQLQWLPLALERYLNVLELQELHPEALGRATALLMAEGRYVEAMPLLSRRLESEAPNIALWQLASRCAFELGALEQAAGWAEQAMGLQPDQSELMAIQARCLLRHGQEREALEQTERAFQLAQGTPQWALVNRLLAPLLLELGFLERCEAALAVALAAEPARPELHLQRAQLLLLQWRLFEGFQEYLWRHCGAQQGRSTAVAVPPDVSIGAISPGQPLALACEGTLGDTLLFARYAQWLQQAKGLNVSVYVQLPLLRLLSHSLGATIPVKPQYQLRHVPAEVPVLPLSSAPALYGTCQEHPELARPYLKADPALIDHWRQKLSLKAGERLVGLNWHGSPLHALEERSPSDIPLESLKPLAALPQTRLLSLQKGFGSEQLDTCSFRSSFVEEQAVVNAELRLEHMAALMALCDLVVTDDSGPAHLAGCLGVPTLVLIPHRCNWRWGAYGRLNPWYPSVTLLRQRPGESWDPLVQQAFALISETF